MQWYKGSAQEEWMLQVKPKYKSQIDILETKNNMHVYSFSLFKQFLKLAHVFFVLSYIYLLNKSIYKGGFPEIYIAFTFPKARLQWERLYS